MECDGGMLADFLETCVSKINESGNIAVPSAVEVTMDLVCSRYADEYLAYYANEMSATFKVFCLLYIFLDLPCARTSQVMTNS